MTSQTGMTAWILPALSTSIRPISIRRSAKDRVPFLTDNGMMRYMRILFVATHISRSLAWTWTTHQTRPDPALQVTEDIFQNTFDGHFDFIFARFVDSNNAQAGLSQTAIDALFTSRGIPKRLFLSTVSQCPKMPCSPMNGSRIVSRMP